MDPIVLIVKHFLNKKGIDTNFDSIDSFFEDGISFPSLISVIFNIDEIPEINHSPETSADKQDNIKRAVQFLYDNNLELEKFKLSYLTTKERDDFLFLIFTRQYFKINPSRSIRKFCSIVPSSIVKVISQDDLVHVSNIFILLNILTNGEVEKVSDDQDNIFDILSETFEKYKIPLVINSTSLESYNQIQFLLQLEIIYDCFSDTIKSNKNYDSEFILSFQRTLPTPSTPNSSSSSSSSSSDSEDHSKSSDDDRYSKSSNDNEEEEGGGFSSTSSDYDDIDIEDDKKNEFEEIDGLAKTVSAIANLKENSNMHGVWNFEEGAKENHIPKYVLGFFDIESIEGLDFELEWRGEEILNLSPKELKNLDIILNFLREKKKIFRILLFNFADTKILRASSVLFYQTFLNCFFLKTSKHEMYQRIIRLLCTHETLPEKYDYSLFTHRKAYACLLFFKFKGTVHFKFDLNNVKGDYLNFLYDKAGVENVISQKNLQIAKKRPTNLVFYQLQLIFDAIEAGPKSRKTVEMFMNAVFNLKKIKVPPFNEITSAMRAKHQSLVYQNEINDKYRNRKLKDDNSLTSFQKEKKKIEKPTTFEQRFSDQEIKLKGKSHKEKIDESFDSFWNKSKLNYKYDNGILYLPENSRKQSQTNWINEISNIQKNVKKRERKSLMVKKPGSGIDLSQSILFNRTKNSFQTKLYKIFYYDEEAEIWKFDSDVFQQFSDDKKINVKNSKTPLILLLNSNENDLISISSNLINGIYPKIDDSNIFVYPLCDRSLSMLNFYVDFTNSEKASIKPIFLLLHVPKSKEKHRNIKLIITEIYSFLSMISDLNIVIMNKDHYLDQVEFMKNLFLINRLFKDKKKQKEFPIDLNIESFSINRRISESIVNKDKNKSFSSKEPKFIMLINDQTVQFSDEIDKNLNNSSFFVDIKNQINNKENVYMHYINVNDSNTYECFLTTMNDIVIKDGSLLLEIEKNLKFINQFKLSEKCIEAMLKDDFHEEVENIIFQRYSILKDQQKLFDEIEKVSYGIKNDFILECQEMCNLVVYHEIENKRKIIKNEIEISSNSHLNFMKELIKQKLFLTKKQIIEMINAHKEFLKNEYFDIIMKLKPDNSINRFYAHNFNIIVNQMEKDKVEFIQMFDPFIEKIYIKENIKVQDLRNNINKGTNYSMKETENLREIKVAVQIGQDLKSEIEQDF